MDQEKKFSTDQELFWSGKFCEDYIKRRNNGQDLSANLSFFSNSLKNCEKTNSCIEFGSNIGMNLIALKMLFPEIQLEAVEINSKAVQILISKIPDVIAHNTSIIDLQPTKQFDLVLTKTVLIHVNPAYLNLIYEKLYNSAKKYILICEYYNPTPVSVEYRGYKDMLFKRDFAGEIMSLYQNLKLLDYGFLYKRDKFKHDDITWFLLEKFN